MRPAQKLIRQKGFTLIELLIVISLIIIITGAVVPSFNSYIENQGVKQAQEAVKDDLRTVQNKALNGEKALLELPNPGDDKVNYWGVEFTQGSSTYTYFVSVDTSTCGGGATREDQRVSDLLPGETVIRSPDGCIFFSYSNGDITVSNSDKIIVGHNDGEVDGCRRVDVESNGLIRLESGGSCSP